MANVYAKFARLLPSDQLLIGAVTAHNADGTSTVTLPGGGELRARGQSVAVGSKAFVKGGDVIGEAPDLTAYEVEV